MPIIPLATLMAISQALHGMFSQLGTLHDACKWRLPELTGSVVQVLARSPPDNGRIASPQVKNNTLRFVRRLPSHGFPLCKDNGVPNTDWHPECSNIWNERVVHVRD